MRSILYLQKNPFASQPVAAETRDGRFILTNKKGEIIFNEPGSSISVQFVLAWGMKIAVNNRKFRLYVNASGFTPSPSKAQIDAVNNNMATGGYVASVGYGAVNSALSLPTAAVEVVKEIRDSGRLLSDWRQSFEEIGSRIQS